MRNFIVLIGVLSALVLSPSAGWSSDASPAQLQIELAQRAIRHDASNVRAHNQLALGLARRARETADVSFYAAAERALETSLRLEAGNLAAEQIRAWILLGQHEFAAALEIARPLFDRFPDNLMSAAMLTDSLIELGRYEEAEEVAQWMLDLRPGAVTTLTRGAYLRELFGDLSGAIEWMSDAYGGIRPGEVEDLAWTLTQIAHLHLASDDPEAAESVLNSALELFPDYHYAVSQLAKVRLAQGRYLDAARLLRKHCELAPHPENFFYLGEALHLAGEEQESIETFARFERLALNESTSNDNANHELVRYYLTYADRPAEALRLARAEARRRGDVHTLYLLAWAQQANGLVRRAETTINRVLRVGVAEPEILDRAEQIALAAGRIRIDSPIASTCEFSGANRATHPSVPSAIPRPRAR